MQVSDGTSSGQRAGSETSTKEQVVQGSWESISKTGPVPNNFNFGAKWV